MSDEVQTNEAEPWKNKCLICGGGGSHMPKTGTLSEQCARQIPCFVCEGRGYHEERRFKHFDNAKVLDDTKIVLNPDTYCPVRKLTLEIDWNFEAQQDGRPPTALWTETMKAIQIGKAVMAAINKHGREKGWRV